VPFSDNFELYLWEVGIVVLCAGVGLVKLHPSSNDSVSDVHAHDVVQVLELVNEVLWVVFFSFVRHGVAIGRVRVAAT
jgi:hypothetical protein